MRATQSILRLLDEHGRKFTHEEERERIKITKSHNMSIILKSSLGRCQLEIKQKLEKIIKSLPQLGRGFLEIIMRENSNFGCEVKFVSVTLMWFNVFPRIISNQKYTNFPFTISRLRNSFGLNKIVIH